MIGGDYYDKSEVRVHNGRYEIWMINDLVISRA